MFTRGILIWIHDRCNGLIVGTTAKDGKSVQSARRYSFMIGTAEFAGHFLAVDISIWCINIDRYPTID